MTSTLPGRARPVMRLARLTGRPYQSPARDERGADGDAARSCGKSSPSASAASTRSSAASTSAGLGADEHDRVADRLDQAHGRRGALGGQRLEAVGHAPELVGRHLLADAREADQVGEADHHLPRAGQPAGLALGRAEDLGLDDVAQVEVDHLAEHRRGQRLQPRGGVGVAQRQLVLGRARLEHEVEGHVAHELGGLGEAAARARG